MGKINAYQAIVLALNTVSLEELKTDNWMIAYPNPGNSTVQLLLPENALITEINVVSTDGKTRHFELVNNSFDAAQLAAGNYFIEAVAGGNRSAHSLLNTDMIMAR